MNEWMTALDTCPTYSVLYIIDSNAIFSQLRSIRRIHRQFVSMAIDWTSGNPQTLFLRLTLALSHCKMWCANKTMKSFHGIRISLRLRRSCMVCGGIVLSEYNNNELWELWTLEKFIYFFSSVSRSGCSYHLLFWWEMLTLRFLIRSWQIHFIVRLLDCVVCIFLFIIYGPITIIYYHYILLEKKNLLTRDNEAPPNGNRRIDGRTHTHTSQSDSNFFFLSIFFAEYLCESNLR